MSKYKQVRGALGERYEAGDTVYLAEIQDSGADGFYARACWTGAQHAMYTKNLSNVETLRGWCGSTEGVSVTALGAGTVVRNLGEVITGDYAGYTLLKVRV